MLICLFKIIYKFSFWFTSGEFSGQSKTTNFLFLKNKLFIYLRLRYGTSLCWNTPPPLENVCLKCTILSWSIWMYFTGFIFLSTSTEVPGSKWPQNIIFGGCLNVTCSDQMGSPVLRPGFSLEMLGLKNAFHRLNWHFFRKIYISYSNAGVFSSFKVLVNWSLTGVIEILHASISLRLTVDKETFTIVASKSIWKSVLEFVLELFYYYVKYMFEILSYVFFHNFIFVLEKLSQTLFDY